jgi:plasmid stabilization system protein ParE
VRDVQAKAEQAVRFMYVALALAAAAPSERQRRILTRYVLVHADTAQRYLQAWRTQLESHVDTRARGTGARTALKRLRREYAYHKDVRDKLASRRQAAAVRRAADLRQTVAMWWQLTGPRVRALCGYAAGACRALGSDALLDRPLDGAYAEAATVALRATCLDGNKVYFDATSYASGERNLLSTTPSGRVGRREMQINDVHDHLEELNALRPLVYGSDEVALLLRGALVIELSTLLDLSFGPPPGLAPLRDGPALVELVERGRGEAGWQLLTELCDRIVGDETRLVLRDLRDRVAAHMDVLLSRDDVLQVLNEIDVDRYFLLADVMLDWLDAAAAAHVDLGTLVIGHRPLRTVKPASSRTVPAAYQPREHANLLDNPYGAMVAGGFGTTASATVAGVIAGRARNRRERWRPPAAAA